MRNNEDDAWNDNTQNLFLKAIVFLILLYISPNIVLIFQIILIIMQKTANNIMHIQMATVKHLLSVLVQLVI